MLVCWVSKKVLGVGCSVVLRTGKCLLAQMSGSSRMIVKNYKSKSRVVQEETLDTRVGTFVDFLDMRWLYLIDHKLMLMRYLVLSCRVVVTDSYSWEKLLKSSKRIRVGFQKL
jgi:hypothetical protein